MSTPRWLSFFHFFQASWDYEIILFLQFFPAVGEEYNNMVQSGYESMMKWDGTMIKKVGHRTPNYEALYVLWFLKAFEVLIFEGFAFLTQSFYFLILILKVPSVYLTALHGDFWNPFGASPLVDPIYGSLGAYTSWNPFRILWSQKILGDEERSR